MIIPDEKLKRLLDILYNRFWLKWRGQEMTEEKWALLMADIDTMMEQGQSYEMAAQLILAFAGELERRKGGSP